MKKLLLGSVAVIGMAAVSGPAMADNHGLMLDVGGHFKGYVTWHDQDETSTTSNERGFDMLKETEIHFSGETTLDNGLTVGVHVEAETDEGDSFDVDESYAYFSGAWGRLNLGNEDGAAYLLQVAAPSADSNVDGIRQFINPVRYFNLGSALGVATLGGAVGSRFNTDGLDYDNDATANSDKVTYLTPVLNGFQAGLSYTFDTSGALNSGESGAGLASRSINGVNIDDVAGASGAGWEIAGRYEGQFDEIGFALGGGYTNVEEEGNAAATDDYSEWNVGLDMDWGAFGLGVVYTENNNGVSGTNDENETWVVGLDYSFGAFKVGGSYLDNENNINGGGAGVETARWTGGVVYTYGPGMTFRGSVSYVDHDVTGGNDIEATSLLAGTQIRF